jgi:Ca-activated chloride channel family protein
MKKSTPALLLLLILLITQISDPVSPQTRERTVGVTRSEANVKTDVVKVDVDLITVDALVLQKNTARVVGNLKEDDFVISEDGARQSITHFSQDSLPLSVLLLIDRGGCLDPFGSEVRRAALEALSRLKPTDEVAVMSYHNNVELLQGFTRNRILIEEALNSVPPHDESANHCLNTAFAAAANYMVRSGNPVGRRVVVAITGVTRNFDCTDGPSGKAATQAVFESGSVVCGIIPRTADQKIENGMMRWATRIGGLARVPSMNIQTLADETGGEVLQDKPENLDSTFTTLIAHLRTRYSLAFVSTNKKRDGSLRKLKIDVAPALQKSGGKLVVKARRSYVAPKG